MLPLIAAAITFVAVDCEDGPGRYGLRQCGAVPEWRGADVLGRRGWWRWWADGRAYGDEHSGATASVTARCHYIAVCSNHRLWNDV